MEFSGSVSSCLTIILCFTVLAVFDCADSQKPKFLKKPKLRYEATVGDSVKLKCLVTGVNDPLFNRTYSVWFSYRNGKTKIVGKPRRGEKSRFRSMNGHHLRIKNARVKDSGKYLCQAHNSFGMINASITLIVHPGSNASVYNTAAHIITPSPPPPVKVQAPVFRRNIKALRIRLEEGSQLKLRCHANGSPQPKIQWHHNGKKLRSRRRNHVILRGWVLNIRSLRQSDSGRYTCIVKNKHGTIRRTYIVSPLKSRSTGEPALEPSNAPNGIDINTHLLKNKTAVEGTDVTFTCKAVSEVPLSFIWLRWTPLTNATDGTADQPVRILNASDPRVRLIRESAAYWSLADKRASYCHKLMLLNVTKRDQGQYSCVVGGGKEMVSYNVFLTVKPKELRAQDSMYKNTSSHGKSYGEFEIPLAALIAVPAAFGAILIAVIIWCYVQVVRHRARQAVKAKSISFAVDEMYGRQVYKKKPSLGITVNRLVTLEELSNARNKESALEMAIRNGDVRKENGHTIPQNKDIVKDTTGLNGVICNGDNSELRTQNKCTDEVARTEPNGYTDNDMDGLSDIKHVRTAARFNTYVEHRPLSDKRVVLSDNPRGCREDREIDRISECSPRQHSGV
ncbi:fibroblast growth factor receptor-like 1 [Nematostella vectensis]|uniref:fibroblast growth factor receptor-like 1 n=1 Tax=Nematostella vectensis TaxID=45351 RepID=UPI002076EF13|nr:fibroblast growth factor receptor-like 1 [Nematostella vectensis]XP_032240570.2 fibroblast growth factor receptor-like 1 [Nematostella vectensis]XP_032240571.2 fibroblast growth factor receptor-like 1 [Nematostella vectensis]XP_032240572.2 fibroblast growth factor receptor-like 1 [Nematostella vectensis]XP_048584446.1 fibroblast growth factor receptor-like 1 [Nematostella vectensis]